MAYNASNDDQDLMPTKLDPAFAYEISHQPGGKTLRRCLECGTCTACCPISKVDGRYNPRKIIRMVLLGMRERVLSDDFIWLCSTLCPTMDICYQLCPKHVRINDIMNVVKNMAVQEGYRPNKLISFVCKKGQDRRARWQEE